MASQSLLFSLIPTKGTNKASQGVAFSLIQQIHVTLFLPDGGGCALSSNQQIVLLILLSVLSYKDVEFTVLCPAWLCKWP